MVAWRGSSTKRSHARDEVALTSLTAKFSQSALTFVMASGIPCCAR